MFWSPVILDVLRRVSAISSTLSSNFSNLAQGVSRDFTITDYIAACLSYRATVGLPQYGTRYRGFGTSTYTGIDVRLAVFNAHLVFNRYIRKKQRAQYGLKKFLNRANALPHSHRPFPHGIIQIGHDYEFPIGRYLPEDDKGPARVIVRFNAAARFIAIISHEPSRADDSPGYYDHYEIPANQEWSTFLFEFFLVVYHLPSFCHRHSPHFT